jgi:hypothetical protein
MPKNNECRHDAAKRPVTSEPSPVKAAIYGVCISAVSHEDMTPVVSKGFRKPKANIEIVKRSGVR